MRTVLVVEDDPTIAAAIAGVLGDEGFEVFVAGDLRRARELAVDSARAIGVLVLDLGLPDGSGEELLEILCKLDRAPPTVLVSADPQRAERAAAAYGLPFASKPFDLALVAASVAVAYENGLRPRPPGGGTRTRSSRRFRAA